MHGTLTFFLGIFQFYSIPFLYVLICSNPLYSILFCSFLIYSSVFCSIMLYSVLLHSIPLYSRSFLLFNVLFRSFRLCFVSVPLCSYMVAVRIFRIWLHLVMEHKVRCKSNGYVLVSLWDSSERGRLGFNALPACSTHFFVVSGPALSSVYLECLCPLKSHGFSVRILRVNAKMRDF